METSKKRILFITQWQFEDALIQTYTLPYVGIIQKITSCYPYVVGVNNSIHSILVKKKGNIVSIQLPPGKRFLFLRWVGNIITLWRIIRKKKIRILHPICTPASAIGTIFKMLDKHLILNIDSFEPHAEPMVENKTWKRLGMKFQLLFYFEKKEAKMADNLIFAAPGMGDYIREKYKTTVTDYFVKPACTDLDAFSAKSIKNKELMANFHFEDKIVGVYAGKFGGIYLEDEFFEFIKNCERFWGKDRFRFLLLSSVSDNYLMEKMAKYHIDKSTTVKLFVKHHEIPLYMGLADFALSPYKPVPSKKYCTPIKDGEYWAMGLPIVITPRISIDSDIIAENKVGAVLESLNEKGYLNAIIQIDALLKEKTRMEIYNQVRPLAEKYRSFSIAENIYRKIYGESI